MRAAAGSRHVLLSLLRPSTPTVRTSLSFYNPLSYISLYRFMLKVLQKVPASLSASSDQVKMLAFFNRIVDWFKSLFWKEEMELTLVGLQNSGKTTFVNVIAVSFSRCCYSN